MRLLLQFVVVGFNRHVGQQFLAGCFDGLASLCFGGCFEGHGDVATDAHIGDAGEFEVTEVVDNCLTLRVEQFLVGHDVYFGNEFHGCGFVVLRVDEGGLCGQNLVFEKDGNEYVKNDNGRKCQFFQKENERKQYGKENQ